MSGTESGDPPLSASSAEAEETEHSEVDAAEEQGWGGGGGGDRRSACRGLHEQGCKACSLLNPGFII